MKPHHDYDGEPMFSLEEARAQVGCTLALKEPYRRIAAGTMCCVSCAVDFGEGLLLWVETEAGEEVDQFTRCEFERFFESAPDAVLSPLRQEALCTPMWRLLRIVPE